MNDAQTARETTVDDSNSTHLNRRQILQGALGAASLTLATPSTLRAQRTRGVSVSPQPGSRTASPGTQISFRGAAEQDVGAIEVRGSKSGAHAGTWIAHSDGAGASFQPDRAFHPGEVVTVRTGLGAAAGDIAEFRFTVSRPLPVSLDPQPTGEEGADQVHAFRSRPDLQPAVIRIDQIEEGLAAGLIFLAPKRGTGLNGAQIIDDRGETVWYFPAGPESEEIYDFRAQQFRGQPVLTWWQGVSAVGQGFGHFVIMDSSYQLVTTVTSGNGYPGADLHEFLITPRDTALFIIYHPIDWQIGVRRPMLDSIVQEVDIETGAVIFEWHSLDHVSVEESHLSIPEDEPDRPFDYFHANSVGEDEDGNLIVSARNTWALYKIDRSTGDVSWRLGGEQSDFRMDEGTETIYQHDARAWPNGELTIFDNGGGPPEVHERSRGIRVSLDLETMTATLVAEYVHPIRILAYTQGNMQVLSNGNVFISWGDEQYMSEYSADGEHLQDWVLPKAKQTYRAYRLPWAGQPLDEPTIAVERKANGEVTIFASWNGATDVADWRVLAGADPGDVTEVARIRRTGFETELGAGPDARYVAVEGLDVAGAMLGRSSTAEVPRADLAAAIRR